MWSAQVEVDEATFQWQPPVQLASGNYRGTESRGGFAITPNAERFLVIEGSETEQIGTETDLVTVENWFAELNRLAPRAL